jgi:hypothetical protein
MSLRNQLTFILFSFATPTGRQILPLLLSILAGYPERHIAIISIDYNILDDSRSFGTGGALVYNRKRAC